MYFDFYSSENGEGEGSYNNAKHVNLVDGQCVNLECLTEN